MSNMRENELSKDGDCPHCGSNKKTKDRNRSRGREGNYYHEQFKCNGCGKDFQVSEEIKARGN